MSRINTNISSLLAQRTLNQQSQSLSKTLERLSTGLAINRGADNPAGLIASENLRSEQIALTKAIGNAERADQVVNIAEGGLQEVSSLLIEVQGLVTESANDAGLSAEEKEANQLQIDSILQTIDRISSSTTFQGTKLLNGNFDFTISGTATTVADFTVNAAKLSTGSNQDVQVVVTASAQHGGVFLSAGGAAIDLSAAGNSLSFEIAGAKGTREFSFGSGTTLTNVAASINSFTSVTGVSAAVSGTGLALKSDGFGSDQFVSVEVLSDGGINDAGAGGADAGIYLLDSADENTALTTGDTAFSAATSPIRDNGQDITAVINGITATGTGKEAQISTDILNISIELTETGAQTLGSVDALTITGGGAKFNLGPSVGLESEVRLGIGNIAARNLGSVASGFLDALGSGGSANVVDGDLSSAQEITGAAISEISALRGRLGSFQSNTIGSTIRTLGVALENTSAAESQIRDADFAKEAAELTRNQILVNAATSALAIANSQGQNALALI